MSSTSDSELLILASSLFNSMEGIETGSGIEGVETGSSIVLSGDSKVQGNIQGNLGSTSNIQVSQYGRILRKKIGG